jgi:hypothetical protein
MSRVVPVTVIPVLRWLSLSVFRWLSLSVFRWLSLSKPYHQKRLTAKARRRKRNFAPLRLCGEIVFKR